MTTPQPRPSPAPAFDSIALEDLDYLQRYKLLTGTVIPRPVAVVSSLGPGGIVNVAPFSNFVILSSVDGLLGFSVGRGTETEMRLKDTLRNVRERGEFVIQTVAADLAATVQACAALFPADVSEAEATGLTLVPSERIATPRIAEASVHLECRLHSVTAFGESHLVAGAAVMVHVAQGLQKDYKIDPLAYGPLARLGGRTYARLGPLISA